jgi:OHCU decarboxylase
VRLNECSADEARAALLCCCGSRAWARRMADERPFEDMTALVRAAARIWDDLSHADWLEAFSAHPRLGEQPEASPSSQSVRWSSHEQAGVADSTSELKDRLSDANRRYEDRFGFVFLTCATGRSGADILAELESRLANDRVHEIAIAGAEQQRITALRLAKLMDGLRGGQA